MTRTSNASNPLRRTSDKKTQITLRHDFRVTCGCALYVAFLETFGEVHSNHKWDQLDICFYSKISILPLSPMHVRRRFLIREKFLFFFWVFSYFIPNMSWDMEMMMHRAISKKSQSASSNSESHRQNGLWWFTLLLTATSRRLYGLIKCYTVRN